MSGTFASACEGDPKLPIYKLLHQSCGTSTPAYARAVKRPQSALNASATPTSSAASSDGALGDLFREPFPGSTWILEEDENFPILGMGHPTAG
jgi:xyloglucan fucosyltransferase